MNLNKSDYILTDAVVDPVTKGNISTYIVKDNIPISFSFTNLNMESNVVDIQSYYYTTVKNKNVIIRCYDKKYVANTKIYVVPMITFQILRATNRIGKCLFILDIYYKLKNEETSKLKRVAIKIVSEKEYKMYENIEVVRKMDEINNNGEIKRPKKQD